MLCAGKFCDSLRIFSGKKDSSEYYKDLVKQLIFLNSRYMKHMSQVLSGAGASTVALPNPNPSTTTPQTTSNLNDVKPFFQLSSTDPSNIGSTCPSHCMCSCPSVNSNFEFNQEPSNLGDTKMQIFANPWKYT